MIAGGATTGQVMARRTIRAVCGWLVTRRLVLTIEGGEHVPASGPALIAARHFHHLYDGCALIAALPRPVYPLVAVDWAGSGLGRRVLEAACRWARWPTVLRADARPVEEGAAVRPAGMSRYLLRATRQVIELLRAGQLVAVFPEGYPTIDPAGTRKQELDQFLPFREGIVRLAEWAERRGAGGVPIIPAGFAYEPGPRWRVWLQFGPPVCPDDYADRQVLLQTLEQCVIALSRQPAHRPAGD